MKLIAPLPNCVQPFLDQNTHPCLLLDKFAKTWDTAGNLEGLSERVQKPVLEGVVRLSQQPPAHLDFQALRQRRKDALQSLGADVFQCTTIGPLTLHLARASALENAGICLHPLYGFVYLPGTGLKGMAHAYACELWLPAQPDKPSAWLTLCQVFGWAPSPWLSDLAKRHGLRVPEDACAGSIVFHDAWPTQWPRLIVDILNNHHANYYQEAEPPGDWENPVPVYFLAVPAPATFAFALSKRRDDTDGQLLRLARQWLEGALCHLGAGAKTNTGYGAFRPAEGQRPALGSPRHQTFETTLELVTPAFLAGANQQAADCDLRPATLRGLLRWWWRTMHAGFVDAAMLNRLEAAVWGDVNAGGAVRVRVEPLSEIKPLLYDKPLLASQNSLPKPLNNKTTQGLWYHSFGMDDVRREAGDRRRYQRCFIAPGTRWRVALMARASSLTRRNAQGKLVETASLPDPELLLEQAKAALWLLCHFGGIGAKERKGFGSLDVPVELREWNLDRCRKAASALRIAGKVASGKASGAPSLEQMLTLDEVPTHWTNYWYAIDRVAAVAQAFAQQHKHCLEKKALGLPRNVRSPARGAFKPGPHTAKTQRHASPVMYHFARGDDGLTIRVIAFPSPELPDDPTLGKSREFLQQLLKYLRSELPRCKDTEAKKGRKPPVDGGRAQARPESAPGQESARQSARLPKSGERVECELLPEKTKKGGWTAKFVGHTLKGPIVNTADVPADEKAGHRVTLIVHSISADGRQVQFRWPRPADDKPRQDPKPSRR